MIADCIRERLPNGISRPSFTHHHGDSPTPGKYKWQSKEKRRPRKTNELE